MTTYKVVPTDNPAPPELNRSSSRSEVCEESQKLSGDELRNEPYPSALPAQVKVYRRRWLMLLIFVLVSTLSAFQWIQFSIITNLIMK